MAMFNSFLLVYQRVFPQLNSHKIPGTDHGTPMPPSSPSDPKAPPLLGICRLRFRVHGGIFQGFHGEIGRQNASQFSWAIFGHKNGMVMKIYHEMKGFNKWIQIVLLVILLAHERRSCPRTDHENTKKRGSGRDAIHKMRLFCESM
jgi:hypothetical protein